MENNFFFGKGEICGWGTIPLYAKHWEKIPNPWEYFEMFTKED